jgi:hypothetical protein
LNQNFFRIWPEKLAIAKVSILNQQPNAIEMSLHQSEQIFNRSWWGIVASLDQHNVGLRQHRSTSFGGP